MREGIVRCVFWEGVGRVKCEIWEVVKPGMCGEVYPSALQLILQERQ